ncbi:MAG: MFS transporter [Candidatus Lokiarchaeota archaeon]|nr:MFS transporter [Candidatus Lokiarchaeota archaeon]
MSVLRIKKSDLIKLSIANVGNMLCYMVYFFQMPAFYKENVFQISLSEVGLLGLLDTISFSLITIPFAISALVFIFAGYLSDKTRTRFGRRRPFLLLVIPSAICYILLGLPPNVLIPMGFPINFILLLIFGTLYACLYRMVVCAYTALYLDLTNPKERMASSISLNLFGMIGTIGAFIIPVFVENITSYLPITLTIGGLYLSLVLFAFFFGPKEDLDKIRELDKQVAKTPTFFQSLKDSLKDKNFKFYLFAALLLVLAYSMMTSVFIDFFNYKQSFIPIEFYQLFFVLVPTAIFAFWFYNKLSKKKTRIGSYKFGLKVGFIIQPFLIFLAVIGNPTSMMIQLFIVFAILLFVLLAVLSFQNAILMDITPPNKEATYTGIFLFISVVGMPIASFLVGGINDIFRNAPSILNFWIYRFGDYPGHDFAYALMILISSLFYFLGYLLLRKVKYKEE